MTTLAAVRGIENLGPAGRRATVDVANSLGINPDWLVAVMSFESAGSFDPRKKNALSGATGLIQILPSTASKLGYTISQLERMSQEEYIRGPVFKYLADKGRMSSLDDVYLAVFYPAAMRQPNSFVVATRGQKAYEQNRGFDSQETGQITKGAIVSTIHGVYNSSQNKPRVEVPGPDFLEPSSSLPQLDTSPILSSTGEPEASQDNTSNENFTSPTLPQKNCWDDVFNIAKGIWDRL